MKVRIKNPIWGVPITFLCKYCPTQFEIVGGYNYSKDYNGNKWNAKINGQYVYKRILIRRKKAEPIVEVETTDNK